MTIKPNAITVNKKQYEDMCQALVKETKECERLKELNRKALNLLDDFLGMVELSPPAQDRFDEILTLLAKADEGRGE